MLSAAISMKAGGLLLLPAVLGWIQYQNGTLKLFQAIVIMIILIIVILMMMMLVMMIVMMMLMIITTVVVTCVQ